MCKTSSSSLSGISHPTTAVRLELQMTKARIYLKQQKSKYVEDAKRIRRRSSAMRRRSVDGDIAISRKNERRRRRR
jgi:hypothetical protein